AQPTAALAAPSDDDPDVTRQDTSFDDTISHNSRNSDNLGKCVEDWLSRFKVPRQTIFKNQAAPVRGVLCRVVSVSMGC
ncbi:MAG: hypothetical protein ABGX16_07100, partial [Pirellulales bacterium]